MKTLLFLIVFFTFYCFAYSQTYLISFGGAGESSSVDSVKVENLNRGITLVLDGNDILRLNIATGITQIEEYQSSIFKIYPNPMNDYSILEFTAPKEGDALLTVIDIKGNQKARKQTYFENSAQLFRLSGLGKGLYIVNITGKNYRFSGKIVGTGNSYDRLKIEKINVNEQSSEETAAIKIGKGALDYIDMEYASGERLKFTGVSGIFSTVKTDIPASDKIITFNFIKCTDNDDNNYQIVETGTQFWMAENLRTTTFNNGEPAGTRWYNDDITNKPDYGGLYSYWTAISSNLCPAGWHIPDDNEWTVLKNYLINNNFGNEGSGDDIAKSVASAYGWNPSENAGSIGNNQLSNNSSGFSGLPGGMYHFYYYTDKGKNAYWWSRSFDSRWGLPYNWLLITGLATFSNSLQDPSYCLSVRCVND